MDRVNWGIIGCGNVTEKKSGPAFNKIEGSRLVAVMRRDAAKAEAYAKRHGVPKFYTDASLLINDPDINAVYIATPPDSHARYAIEVMKAGKAAYVEKPMARNVAECEEMIRVSNETGQPLFVAYYRRRLPCFLKIKELVDNRVIGDIKTIHVQLHHQLRPEDTLPGKTPWRLMPEISGGGYFHDLASHQFDYLEYLLGPVKEAKGISLNQAGLYPADDMVTAAFVFESGVSGTGSWCFTVHENLRTDTAVLVGSEGRITFSFFDNQDIFVEKSDGSMEKFTVPHPENIQQPLIQTIVDQMLGKGSCPSTGLTGIRASMIMEAITL
ncbi:MAG TPA: Gfo/Idh/MocA family oxidoreductase [Bacteroidales bacterium]|nr:Gfo/Idh/MocA family oxidoreductase [Bacteroidales bacterium]